MKLVLRTGGLSLAIVLFLILGGPRPHAAWGQEAARVWTAQKSGVLARLTAVFFVDRDHGWAAGSNGTLLRTEDGGDHWRRAALPERESREPINDLWFFDAARGCLLGEYGLYDRKPGLDWSERIFVLGSADGGANWLPGEMSQQPALTRAGLSGRTLSAPAEKPREKGGDKPEMQRPPEPVLLRLGFAGDRVGWACGEAGSIQTTRDGGRSWQLQAAATKKLLYDVAAISERQAVIVGAGGTILSTLDGGRTWSERPSGVAQTLRAVHFLNAKLGWAAGTGGVVIATQNGGASWTPQSTGVSQALNDIVFLTPAEGWAAGERGLLLHTTDGGATWEALELGTHANLLRLAFIAPDRGWVVGMSGAVYRYAAADEHRH